MTGFTKLFSSLIHSTVWQEAPHVKLCWVTMLAMVSRHGIVEASVPGLAKAAGVTIAEAEDALSKFLSPDPYSRSKEADGRRVEVVDGGWKLINHDKYRSKMSDDERRERDAARKRDVRARVRMSADSPQTSEPVREVSHTDAEADTDPNTECREESTAAQPVTERRIKSVPPPPTASNQRGNGMVAQRIRSHGIYALLDASALGPMIEMRAYQWKKPIGDVLDAIDDCALKSEGLGLKAEVLQSKLISFIRNAGPKNRPEVKPPAPENDDPETIARLRRMPRRRTAQDAPLGVGGPDAAAKAKDALGRLVGGMGGK